MKKIISALFILSFVFSASAMNKINIKSFNGLKSLQKLNYTCIYEYYEEVIDSYGNVTYLYVDSEIVECGVEDAGKTFTYIYEQNNTSNRIKPKRHGTGS